MGHFLSHHTSTMFPLADTREEGKRGRKNKTKTKKEKRKMSCQQTTLPPSSSLIAQKGSGAETRSVPEWISVQRADMCMWFSYCVRVRVVFTCAYQYASGVHHSKNVSGTAWRERRTGVGGIIEGCQGELGGGAQYRLLWLKALADPLPCVRADTHLL